MAKLSFPADVAKGLFLRSNFPALGRFGIKSFYLWSRKGRIISGNSRLLLDAIQPVDPLRSVKNPPPINIVMPFVRKDLAMLPHAVAGAVRSSKNPIQKVLLITPNRTFADGAVSGAEIIDEILEKVGADYPSLNIEIRRDEEVLGESLVEELQKLVLSPRYNGWVTQQLVKILAVMQSDSVASLVVDSDTVLQFPRVWVDGLGRQALSIGQECREVPFLHANKFLGITSRPLLSFVTHHQLVQKDLLQTIFPDGAESVGAWLRFADPRDDDGLTGLKLSEYETYGAFVYTHHPERTFLATWGNGSGIRDMLNPSKKESTPPTWPLSVSYHHYRSDTISDPKMF